MSAEEVRRTELDVTNQQLRDIWINELQANQWPQALDRLWPLQYPAMSAGCILFVGLNPSHNEQHDLLRVRKRFAEDLRNQARIRAVIEHQELALGQSAERRRDRARV